MPVTPETLTRHELCGLDIEVVEAANPDLVGIEGRVVEETENTLVVESGDRARTVPKRGATFEFALPDGHVLVEGNRLVARPARRTETAGGSIWH